MWLRQIDFLRRHLTPTVFLTPGGDAVNGGLRSMRVPMRAAATATPACQTMLAHHRANQGMTGRSANNRLSSVLMIDIRGSGMDRALSRGLSAAGTATVNFHFSLKPHWQCFQPLTNRASLS